MYAVHFVIMYSDQYEVNVAMSEHGGITAKRVGHADGRRRCCLAGGGAKLPVYASAT